MALRLATAADAAAIQAIYAPYVRDTAVSFEVTVPTVVEMEARISKTLIEFPWLVWVDEKGAIGGYAYASRHRERAAYQWGVDVTVYVQARGQRGGVRALHHPFCPSARTGLL